MGTPVLYAKRIKNGQSEIWTETDAKSLRVVSTNSILYPVRTICPLDESETFLKAFANGPTAIPAIVASGLASNLKR